MITIDVWKDGQIVTFCSHQVSKRCFRLKKNSRGDFSYMTVWRLSMIFDDDTILVEGRNLKITSLIRIPAQTLKSGMDVSMWD